MPRTVFLVNISMKELNQPNSTNRHDWNCSFVCIVIRCTEANVGTDEAFLFKNNSQSENLFFYLFKKEHLNSLPLYIFKRASHSGFRQQLAFFSMLFSVNEHTNISIERNKTIERPTNTKFAYWTEMSR